jgi:hypothetical protein
MPFDIDLEDPGSLFNIDFGGAIVEVPNFVAFTMLTSLFNIILLDDG